MEPRLDEFRALSLLLQHRALVHGLDLIDAALEAGRDAQLEPGERATQLLPLLQSFTQALPTHFAEESKSTTALLESARPAFRARLQQLDGEHPHLLTSFELVVDGLVDHGRAAEGKGEPPPFHELVAQLTVAIAAFRRHEAEEDALFME